MGQMLAGMAKPASLMSEPQQRLHHRQRQQLGIRQLRRDADLGTPGHQIGPILQRVIDPRVQCRRKGVQIGVHETSTVESGLATPIMDALQRANADRQPLELII